MKIRSLICGMFLAYVGISTLGYAEPSSKRFVENPEGYFQKEEVSKDQQASQNFVEHPELYLMSFGPSDQEKRMVGNYLTDILRKECDIVKSYLRDDAKGGKDLIVLCYQKDDSRPEWGLNLDHVCRTYARVSTFLGIETEAWLVSELSDAGVNSRMMSPTSAKELSKIVGKYLLNNERECQDWTRFIQENYGPLSPKEED